MTILSAITGYVRESMDELRRVRWPTRNQAIRLSLIVIVFTLTTAVVYGIVDFVLGRGMGLLLQFA